ncbi:MAG: TetM/TetW/TetO/TetS family tetracycline resistance ribosomal protection protein [Lachnospiraceae bacterium]|nr:TetM/TetW/TetO/TetS family tetracycline resistance ribosomal protection protein [Lachnospiraceae bacterium]
MKKLSIGILAHVDAGKTTLTESILYTLGEIRTQGRVDNGDAFLDTESLEKKRGVTIYSKQAVVSLSKDSPRNLSGEDVRLTFIDTPGHTDFAGETERAMSVMDLAVLIISAPDGVTDSVKKLAYMLSHYRVPYVIYVNKMDMPETSRNETAKHLKKELGSGAIEYMEQIQDILEDIATLSESTIEKYLDEGFITNKDITSLFYSGKFHPVLFGSAIKNEGTEELIKVITKYLPDISYREELSAKIFKIAYENGHKLSFAKITGGEVSVRDTLPDERLGDEKITQIRMYNGGRYETLQSAGAGDVVTFVGVEGTFTGMGIGMESDDTDMINRPVLRYKMILQDDVPLRTFIPKIKELASEDPLLNLDTGKNGDEINISVMGDFQLEILALTIEERFGIKVTFDNGEIIYKETITEPVIGYGHFEPLRHYAEVQLLMEPLPQGSGIEVGSAISVNELGINWQKTVMSALIKDLPAGVLTGAELTDIRFTITGGRAHIKHTDSQDFREAVRRAVRQGLMKTGSVLLEPYYEFSIFLPAENLGKAINDISLMNGSSSVERQDETGALLKGAAPAKELVNYQSELTKYTSGQGRISLSFHGYKPCDASETDHIVEKSGYDPEKDPDNVSGSIFVEHGAGRYVPWDECEEMMHVPKREAEFLKSDVQPEEERLAREAKKARRIGSLSEKLEAIGTDEIDEILRKATHSNAGVQSKSSKWNYYHRNTSASSDTRKRVSANAGIKPKYLLVDGYNIIHAWDELKMYLSDGSIGMDSAKYKLLDIMSEYRVLRDTEIIVVFDAYKAKGHVTEKMDYLGVHIVYTKEAETADQYIARFTIQNAKDLDITVATSDGMVQLIIRGEGSRLMSARDLLEDVKTAKNTIRA